MKQFLITLIFLVLSGGSILAIDPTTKGDFDGDGITDVAVFDAAPMEFPIRSTYFRYISSITGQTIVVQWGHTADLPVSADYDGDGITDPSIFRSYDVYNPQDTSNTYWINGSFAGIYTRAFASSAYNYRPAGDFDGDAKADPASAFSSCDLGDPEDPNDDYCQSLFAYQLPNGESFVAQIFGYSVGQNSFGGGIPASGDYEGSGTSNIAVYRTSEQKFIVYGQPYSTLGENIIKEQYLDIDFPAVGDYNGDGRTDFAGVKNFRSSTVQPMTWKIRYNRRGQTVTSTVTWGMSNEFPVPGDYDGDGRTDIAVWNKSTGLWTIRRSSDLQTMTRTLGDPNDIPTTFPTQQWHLITNP